MAQFGMMDNFTGSVPTPRPRPANAPQPPWQPPESWIFDPAKTSPIENRIGESQAQMLDEMGEGTLTDFLTNRNAPITTTSPKLSRQAGFENIPTAPAAKHQDRVPQGYPQRQQFADESQLTNLDNQFAGLWDKLPELHKPPLADPIRPRPLITKGFSPLHEGNPNLPRIKEIRGRLRELDTIETDLMRSKTGPRLQEGELDRRTLRGKLSNEESERFKTLVNQGVSHRQIADELGIGKSNVTRKIKALQEQGEVHYAPGRTGGRAIPSMPQFKFQDKAPEQIDEDYYKALQQYLKDIRSWIDYRINGARYA